MVSMNVARFRSSRARDREIISHSAPFLNVESHDRYYSEHLSERENRGRKHVQNATRAMT